MKKYILFLCLVLFAFSGCRPSVAPEEKLIVAYEKYIDDIIAEYIKIDNGDIEAYNNIAPLSEKGIEIREQIRDAIFNEEQRQKLNKIEEKRKSFFENR